jgi:hypothetical protein
LLSEAQKTAASTERSVDYSLLSELLIHRVRKGSERNARAGISRAVEIVDEISDDALLGLTVAHAISCFTPTTGVISEGLNKLDSLFNKIIYDDLPFGDTWIEHLDILDAIRIQHFSGLKKIDQFYIDSLAGYIDLGIEINTENYKKATEIIEQAQLPKNMLCVHELRENYVRLQISNINQLDIIVLTYDCNSKKNTLSVPLSEEQKNALRAIYNLYNTNQGLKRENIQAFMREWDKHNILKKLRIWWDAISTSFIITVVGRVLANANAQRCEPGLPELD